MGDTTTPQPIGGRALRQNAIKKAEEERAQAVLLLRTHTSPSSVDELFAILRAVHQLERRHKDAEGSYLDPAPTKEEEALAQSRLDNVQAWLRSTLEDSKLERHFRYSHEMPYPSAQYAALRILEAAGFLKNARRGSVADRVWESQITQIDRDRRYLKSLLNEPDATPSQKDKISEAIFNGFVAIPLAAASVVAIGEVLAAFGAAAFGTACAAPGGVTVIAFLIEHYVAAEVIAAFAVGTIVTIKDSGGIEGFGEQLKTPQGAIQNIGNLIFLIAQLRSGGYVRVRGRVTARTPTGFQIRVEETEEIHPVAAPPAKVGKLNVVGRFPGRPMPTYPPGASTGKVPEVVRQATSKSIQEARMKFGRYTHCDDHKDHHLGTLGSLKVAQEPSDLGGEHVTATIMHDGKKYYVDSSIEQFTREGSTLSEAAIRQHDATYGLALRQAMADGVLTVEQYQALKKIAEDARRNLRR